MIRAKLSYNPYTLETSAVFNGKEPHINSLIEKYKNARLQEWIKDVPRVFYEELNGYDFQLDFIGTSLEYNELRRVFEKAIPSSQYVLEHCKVIGNRKSKLVLIKELFEWLKETNCDYFDYDDFSVVKNDLVDAHYPIFIINGSEEDVIGLEDFSVSAEFIDDYFL